jgi:phage-related minor tail protein
LSNDNETKATEITQEAYNALKTELEAEKGKVDLATQPLKERIASLEADLKSKGEEVAQHVATVQEKDKSFASLTANFEGAVSAYKGQVLKANPLVPPELVAGATIAEIDASVEKASAIVGKIKEGLATAQQTVTVPAGAPGRTPPDISGMSPREKITHGIEAKRREKK